MKEKVRHSLEFLLVRIFRIKKYNRHKEVIYLVLTLVSDSCFASSIQFFPIHRLQ